MNKLTKFLSLVIVILLSISPALAEDSAGLLPVPDYTGELANRQYLSGDWNGTRTEWANKGVQLNLDWNQVVQGVSSGGLKNDTKYGSTVDYTATFDLMKMGVLPGALINFRGESRVGNSVNKSSGSVLPVNTDAFFPLTSEPDQDIGFTITTLSYTQFLSEEFGIMLGKFDTLDGDQNEFASGRGTTQFMNSNFVFNSTTALRLPYSTLGGGLIWMPGGEKSGTLVKSLLFNTKDSSESSGFNDFNDGLSWITEADFQHKLGEKNLPGGQNIGFLYSFDQDFKKVGSRLVFERGEGLKVPTSDSTWALYWSGWQYLTVKDSVKTTINVTDGKADRQGLGVFARAGFADHDTNPAEFSFSLGLGGRGVDNRVDDTYGLGYYYTRFQTTLFTDNTGIENSTQGAELYYSLAITPASLLTLDAQMVDSMLPGVENSVILGGRVRVSF